MSLKIITLILCDPLPFPPFSSSSYNPSHTVEHLQQFKHWEEKIGRLQTNFLHRYFLCAWEVQQMLKTTCFPSNQTHPSTNNLYLTSVNRTKTCPHPAPPIPPQITPTLPQSLALKPVPIHPSTNNSYPPSVLGTKTCPHLPLQKQPLPSLSPWH